MSTLNAHVWHSVGGVGGHSRAKWLIGMLRQRRERGQRTHIRAGRAGEPFIDAISSPHVAHGVAPLSVSSSVLAAFEGERIIIELLRRRCVGGSKFGVLASCVARLRSSANPRLLRSGYF